jgi:glycosyltransferase involved in cell wall biosynthesis
MVERDTKERLRLLFISRRPPLPLTNGARIRTHRLLTGLSRRFDTTFLTFDHHPESADGACEREQLLALLPGIEVVTVPGCGPGRRVSQATTLLRRRSWTFGRYDRPAMRAAIHELVASQRFDLVHYDDLGAALHGPVTGVVNVYSAPDIEQTIADHTSRTSHGARRAFARREHARISREELRIWRTMDMCLAVSPEDAASMTAGGARAVRVCPNGADPVEPLPLTPLAPTEPLRALFVGSGGYLPYQRGIAWFAREVMPRLGPECLQLDVVGALPPSRAENVRYHGNVDDLAPWYQRSHVVIVPVFEGSGTRLKVLEAAAYGRPIVSTPLGAHGLPVIPDKHYRCRSDACGFVDALLEVRAVYEGQAVDLARQVNDARRAIGSLFWPRITDDLSAMYVEACAARVR